MIEVTRFGVREGRRAWLVYSFSDGSPPLRFSATEFNWASSPCIRQVLARRDGGMHCAYCGSADDLTNDHIIPQHFGGSDDLSNLQILCRRCNCSKGINPSPRNGWWCNKIK